jgi:hypothetical protein
MIMRRTMIATIAGLGLLAAGIGGWSLWLVPVAALLLVDRSWHAKLAYRQRFTGTMATHNLPYATTMCVLQAGLTAAATYGLGRILGAALVS